MEWIDRNLQREILTELSTSYPESKTYEYWIDAAIAQTADAIETIGEAEEYVSKRSANLHYLAGHKLIVFNNKTRFSATVTITEQGIDFLAEDGGLSAILGVVTVKLHSDTIQALLSAKIDEADIPQEEKGRLKAALGKVGDAVLATLTEKAINAISATDAVAAIQSVLTS